MNGYQFETGSFQVFFFCLVIALISISFSLAKRNKFSMLYSQIDCMA